jgi:hypothetical protein
MSLAKTTPAAPPALSSRPQTVVIPKPHDFRVCRREHGYERPPLISRLKSESAHDAPGARVIVEWPHRDRRAYDRPINKAGQAEYNTEPRRTQRSLRVYDDVLFSCDYQRNLADDDKNHYNDEPIARALLRRRATEPEPRRRPQRPLGNQQVAEAGTIST